MAFALKRLSRDDMAEAARVHRAAFDERFPWLVGLHTPQEDRAYFEDQVFAACELWGAMQDALTGFVAFRENWVDQLYVLPERQRQGAGGALLKVAQAAFPSLSLWTFQRNTRARSFYEGHGFVAAEATDGHGNEEREPDVLYHWKAGS